MDRGQRDAEEYVLSPGLGSHGGVEGLPVDAPGPGAALPTARDLRAWLQGRLRTGTA